MRQVAPLILWTVLAIHQQEARKELEELLPGLEQAGRANVVDAIRRIVAGKRDAELLCDGLNLNEAMFIEAILQGLDDPSTLQDLLPDEEQ